MDKRTVLLVYGTRPEAIKMAPLVHALRATDRYEAPVAVTGQHREMLDQVNALFGISPDHDLNIIQPRQTLAGITEKTIQGVTEVLRNVMPDAVVVQGDTTTAMAAGLAAFYQGIPVVHLEAGLRSGNLTSPFPEEANRRLLGQIATLHLAPTATGKDNLLSEGVPPQNIVVTGNTVIDALLGTVKRDIEFAEPALRAITARRRILLVTIHRRENQGKAMVGVGKALARLAAQCPGMEIVLPLHRNPAVREAVLPEVAGVPNITITEPLGYVDFTKLLSLCHVVLTDSGGVQEEAPALGKPVLVMRDNTERPEAVAAGTARLIGTDEQTIVDAVNALITDSAQYSAMAKAVNPYGDGGAAERAVAAIDSLLGMGQRRPDFVA
ncbi:UDP-N-acetylglucosamine 2-epimerase (non-hydrolyzing) [Arthrobacter alkaliphilus]|uniref:non-hydrolyzing UDP-N-acetylglucosamine 2-epimerase n=1 Tax=Arthrobacter alkaliphilus TaxID=369936 RepID=UPI002285CBA7|nr:UDP-N-acetylglucosamine 2-epimerase (non-hydrolyzing) [Arthrobacter alkaliphilus]